MTKRERLRRLLAEKELKLQEFKLAQGCDCICHQECSEILHAQGCCIMSYSTKENNEFSDLKQNILILEQEIISLKIKLRKSL